MIDKITEENFIDDAISTADAIHWAAESKAKQELDIEKEKDNRLNDPMTAYKFLKEQSLFYI
jgi:hypothetical protein